MTAELSWTLWVMVLVSSIWWQSILAVIYTMATVFMVAVPRLMTDMGTLRFFMCTMSNEDFKVYITTEWFTGKPSLNDNVTLSKVEVQDYLVNKMYYSPTVHGYKWTYRLVAQFAFGLTVVVEEPHLSADTFLALPVECWWLKYFVFELNNCPSIQLITDAGQNLTVTVKTENTTDLDIADEDLKFWDKNSMTITLRRWEAYSFSIQPRNSNWSWTGTIIRGQTRFGVVSGSCGDYVTPTECSAATAPMEIFTEMLLPLEWFGSEFVVIHIPAIFHLTYFHILAGSSKTLVNITKDHSGHTSTLFLDDAGDGALVYFNQSETEAIENSLMVRSDKDIQVILVQQSPCTDDNGSSTHQGDATILLIIPNRFFYVKYIWRTPKFVSNHYVSMVIKKVDVPHLILDGAPLPNGQIWNQVLGSEEYKVGHLKVTRGDHFLESSKNHKFMCYFYGLDFNVSYMHPGGYQDCYYTSQLHNTDDQVDNDCDGLVDEELVDYEDNDNDTSIDEDNRSHDDRIQVDGNWGNWQDWSCNPRISTENKFRTRQCDNPPPSKKGRHCDGPSLEFNNEACPKVPVDGEWGSWQEWTCKYVDSWELKVRTRQCDNPPPRHGGLECVGEDEEVTDELCPPEMINRDDGHWGQWLSWACDSETVTHRIRLCNNPPPQRNGKPCSGDQLEITNKTCDPVEVECSEGFPSYLFAVPVFLLLPVVVFALLFLNRARQQPMRHDKTSQAVEVVRTAENTSEPEIEPTAAETLSEVETKLSIGTTIY